MAAKAQPSGQALPAQMGSARILIIEARYYEEISRELLSSATAELQAADASFECLSVPGALELPLALAQAIKGGRIGSSGAADRFDGCVALGCVIRGETSHYDTVCRNSNHWLMRLAVRHAIALGNGILTVENRAQAMARAEGGRTGKGADAVRACLALIGIARAFGREEAP
jgi:6,7-dimethyl-8-ribityllumazine synthase